MVVAGRSDERLPTLISPQFESTKEKEKSLPTISVRTLLPLAYYVRVMSTSDKEVTHENRVPPADSTGQVIKHRESTDLQYRLVDRAIQLGWPRERVEVIDDDLGKSGASAERRLGFQHLLAEIGLGKVGVVVSLDASRLARNNRDWYQLLELCSLFGVLIADAEQLYDPRLSRPFVTRTYRDDERSRAASSQNAFAARRAPQG